MEEKRISIVTPCYNSALYIEKTIVSVMNQSYGNYEHIIIDGGSNDSTLDIICKYEGKYPMKWISEKDNGMYDAINKGFSMATGEIYAWINSDDIYFPWAFATMNRVMHHSEYNWCTTGQYAFCNEDDQVYFINRTFGPTSFSRERIRAGLHNGYYMGYIMQEGSFWRRALWEKAGGIDISKRYAGDYWLWRKFAEYEPLYSINTAISAFRRHDDQLSANKSAYEAELPPMSTLQKIVGKTKIPKLMNALFHPNHSLLLQVEKL